MSSTRDKLFYADAAKGYTIKVLVDVLSGPLSRATINLTKEGILIRRADQSKVILFDSNLPRENFRSYVCRKPQRISLNLKHLQKMVRNVKKKDSMVLFIDKNNTGKLGLSIRPEGGTTRRSSRTETVYIAIQEENGPNDDSRLPEEHIDGDDTPSKVYGYPMVIEASDFQKIKKMTQVGKVITVKMQSNNYISFYCDLGEVFSTELEFGEIIDDPETDSESEEEQDDGSELESEEDEILDEEASGSASEASGSGSDEYESDDEVPEDGSEGSASEASASGSDAESEGEVRGWYEANFYTNIFGMLVKLPGLCSQMQFYAPKIKGYPLKLKMKAGTGHSILGDIQVYIKDIEQINAEQNYSQTHNDEGTFLGEKQT